MMPYISEELYQKLPVWPTKSKTVSLAGYPEPRQDHFFEDTSQFDSLFEVITDIRKLLGTLNLPPKSFPQVHVSVAANEAREHNEALVREYGEFVASLAKTGEVRLLEGAAAAPKGCMSVLSSKVFTVNLEVGQFIKVEDEIKKIQKAVTEKEKLIDALKKKQASAEYQKTPEDIKQKDKEKLELYEAELATLRSNIDGYKKLV